jgi:exonuclease SbcC
MKPLSLKLRGAVGIHDGLGLDDVSIDFGGFQSGIIALVGPNGSGKTTILENLHPYLQLASREGSLSNHFRLRDSYRDFTFELAGHTYRSYILIDAKTAKTEAYLYRDGQPLNDGKVNTYKAEIEKLLGSPELFFRSIFSCQNAESITSLTAGKRKELFMELLGLQRYDRYAEHCKLQGDEVEKDVAGRRGRLEQIQAGLEKRPIVVSELDQINRNLGTIEEETAKLQFIINERTAQLAESDRLVLEDKQKGVQVHDLGNEIMILEGKKWKLNKDFEAEGLKLKDRRIEVEQEVARKQQIIEHKHEIEQSVIRLQMLRLELREINERREQVLTIEREQEKAREKYQAELSAHRMTTASYANEERSLENEKKHLLIDVEASAQNAEERLERARKTASLIDEVPCKGYAHLPEQCQLLTTAVAAKNTIAELEENLRASRDPVLRQERGLADLEARIKANIERIEALVEPTNHVDARFAEQINAIGFDRAQHSTVKLEIQTLEAKKWESLLEELRIAETVIEEKHKALGELSGRVIDVSSKYHEEDSDLDRQITAKRIIWESVKASLLPEKFHTQYLTLKTDLGQKQNQLKVTIDQRSNILGDIQFRQEMLKQLDQSAVEAEAIEAEVKGFLSRLENWRLLQRACSKDGIPALELDAAGPAVSRIANELLASTFGTRFQISFETTKMSKDNKKQLETFEIRVYGAEGEKRIEDLSGGQRVWIEKAIQEAIAIYLSEKSGKEYLTSYADESDGALDPDNKQNFLDMLRESFKLGRRYFTLVITQTPEIWQQIQQRIHLVPAEGKLEFIY